VELLPPTVLHRPGFEVWFVGEEAKVDQSLSGAWLRERTADWTWKTHVLASPTRRAIHQHLTTAAFLLADKRAFHYHPGPAQRPQPVAICFIMTTNPHPLPLWVP
jgi:hypothetical protein